MKSSVYSNTQKVLDAANGASSWGPEDCLNDAPFIAAAALRAAADQVVPEDLSECETYTNEAIRLNLQAVRRRFIAIAAEVEGKADG